MPASSSSPTPPEPRTARLEARLALYAQYATLVADEVEAAWSDDPAHAGVRARALAEERDELARRYEALRTGVGVEQPEPERFGDVLADAVIELDHQAAVERSLRARLDALHHGGRLLGGGTEIDSDMDVGRRALGEEVFGGQFLIEGHLDGRDEHGAAGPDVAEHAAAADAAESAVAAEDDARTALPPEIGGALVVARSRGVGGLLAGQFPGIVAGVDAAVYATTDVADPSASARARVDLTF